MFDATAHLSEKAAAYLLRSDAERIAYIRSPRWIGYDKAKDIVDRLESLLTHPKSHRMPNLLVVGDTNNGKTMLVKRFCAKHPPDDDKDGDNATVPVLFVQAPPVPDEGRFYNGILEFFFAPYKPSDRTDRKQFQAIKLMRAVGLRMLVIDEIHHILAGNLTRQKIFLNVIKFLGNELEIPIVGVGTKSFIASVGKQYCIDEKNYIVIDSVDNQLCPCGVTCIWEGEFILKMNVFADGKGYIYDLGTSSNTPDVQPFDDYKIEFIAITPDECDAFTQEKFKVELILKKD